MPLRNMSTSRDSMEEQTINSVLGVVGDGSQSGIGFYMTTDKDKVNFTQVKPPPKPKDENEKKTP
jgi:hypothetical protein